MKKDRYILEKALWTKSDFEQMGWHDVYVHGIASGHFDTANSWMCDFVLDIDYIFKWEIPDSGVGCFWFWMSPCTLVFHNVMDLDMEMSLFKFGGDDMQLSGIKLAGEYKAWNGMFMDEWMLEFEGGKISLKSDGYTQYVRKYPVLTNTLMLAQSERGGICFDRKIVDLSQL